MRKLFWQMMVSLDGYSEGPNGELDWHVVDADFLRYVQEMLASIGAMLLGRKTYRFFADYWPTATNPEAARMNALPKIVFSRTLANVEWSNSRLVEGDVAEEVAALKHCPGGDLAVFGSANLAATLMRLDLIDEYRIFVAPVVLGAGKPMFADLGNRKPLTLAKVETLGSGVVALTYRP